MVRRASVARPEAPATDDRLRIDYMALGVLERWPRNPKLHDDRTLDASIKRFGYVMPVCIDEGTGRIVAGHGRIDALLRRKAAGLPPPARVEDRGDDWYLPVVRGVRFASEEEAEAYLIGDNESTSRGGYDNALLAELLSEHMRVMHGLEGTGFDEQTARDVVAAQERLAAMARDAKGPTAPSDFPEITDGQKKTVTCPRCQFKIAVAGK